MYDVCVRYCYCVTSMYYTLFPGLGLGLQSLCSAVSTHTQARVHTTGKEEKKGDCIIIDWFCWWFTQIVLDLVI